MDAGRIAQFFEINKYLFEALRHADIDRISSAFLWVMIALFLASLASQIYGRVVRKRDVRGPIAPSQLSALGVLGTFVGVAVGLATFNVNDLDASIPRLLEGLKVAFSTSIFGLLGSTTLRATHHVLFVMLDGGGAGSLDAAVPGVGSPDEAQLLALRLVDLELQKHGTGIAGIREQLNKLEQKIATLRGPETSRTAP